MTLLTILISVGLLMTLVSLGLGVASMAQGGQFDQAHSTELMFARVGSQAITLVLLLVALFVMHG